MTEMILDHKNEYKLQYSYVGGKKLKIWIVNKSIYSSSFYVFEIEKGYRLFCILCLDFSKLSVVTYFSCVFN